MLCNIDQQVTNLNPKHKYWGKMETHKLKPEILREKCTKKQERKGWIELKLKVQTLRANSRIA